MKLLKRVNRLIGLEVPDEPLDLELTQADIAAELHYPEGEESRSATLRVALVEAEG